MRLRVLGLLVLLLCLAEPATASAADNDLAITQVKVAEAVTYGGSIRYTVSVQNNGTAQDIATVVVTVPSGTRFVGSAGCTTPDGGATVRCITTVNAGAAKEVIVFLEPDAIDTVAPATFTVSGTGTDPNSGNNSATAPNPTRIDKGPTTLTVAFTEAPPTATAGESVRYKAVVTNTSTNVRAHGVTLALALPAGATFVSATGGSCAYSAPTLMCGLETLATGAGATVTLTVQTGGPGAYPLTATAAASTFTHATTASTTTKVEGPPTDLGVRLTGPATGFENDTLTYESTVTNLGSNEAQGVTVSVTVPPGMAREAAEAVGGCTDISPSTVSCMLGTIPAGQSAKVTVKANPANVGNHTLSTAVQSAARDDNGANDAATFTTSAIAKVADLSVKISDPGPVLVRTTFDLEFSVVNAGPAPADGARFDITIPQGVTYTIKARPRTPWLCNQLGQVLECLMQRIGATSEPKVVLAVRAERARTYAWSGKVTSATPDPVAQPAAQRTVNVVTELPTTPTDPADPGDPTDPAPPKLALTTGLAAETVKLAKGIKVALKVSRRASVRLALAVKQRGGALTLATRTVSAVSGQRTLTLKLSKTARRTVSRLKVGTKLILSVTATPADGRAVRKRLTLKVAKGGRLRAA